MKSIGRRRHIALAVAAFLVGSIAWPRFGETSIFSSESASAAESLPIASFDSLRVDRGGVEQAIIPPDSFDAPADRAVPPPAAIRFGNVTPQPGTWAVVLGVNDYPGSRYDLGSAVNDANDVAAALAGMGVPADHMLVMRDRQVNRRTISMSVDWLNAHAGPDAVAVFFYAGHVRKIGSGREAMVGADGTLFSDSDLATKMRSLQATRAWIGIAACYGGGFTEVLAPGRILTGAAGANDLAYDNSLFQRSYMVEYMVRRAMIDNRASANVQASFGWATAELSRDYPNRVPVQIDYGRAPLDLRPPGAATRWADPQPAPAPPPHEPSGGGSQPSGPPVTTPPTGSGRCQVNYLGVRVCT